MLLFTSLLISLDCIQPCPHAVRWNNGRNAKLGLEAFRFTLFSLRGSYFEIMALEKNHQELSRISWLSEGALCILPELGTIQHSLAKAWSVNNKIFTAHNFRPCWTTGGPLPGWQQPAQVSSRAQSIPTARARKESHQHGDMGIKQQWGQRDS